MANKQDKYRVAEPREAPVKKGVCQRVGNYIWNSEKKTILDRTPSSWGKISAFYIVFYIILGGFSYGCFSVFLETINGDFPKIRLDHGSFIMRTPGLSYFPKPDTDNLKKSTPVISFDKTDASTYSDMVSSIDDLLDAYTEDTVSVSDSCTDNTGVDSACSVNRNNLGDCDGVSDPTYGYSTGEPCLFFSVNKIIGFTPEAYTSNPDTSILGGRWSADHVTLNCVEKRERTDGNPTDGAGSPEYFPAAGIPMGCFPYCGPSVNYAQAIAAVKFSGIHLDEVIRIACTVYAANIEPSIKDKLGVAIFALEIAS